MAARRIQPSSSPAGSMRWSARLASETTLANDEGLTARNMAELLVGGIDSMVTSVLSERGKPYIALFGSYFLFIFVCNLMGLVPGFVPATGNFNITFALGVFSFFALAVLGMSARAFLRVRRQGVGSSAGAEFGWLAI